MSNLLAAVGRGQLRNLDITINRRRGIRRPHEERLSDLSGVAIVTDFDASPSNAEVTVPTIDMKPAGVDREAARRHLRARSIDERPAGEQMQPQQADADERVIGDEVAAILFGNALRPLSVSLLTDEEYNEVSDECGSVVRRSRMSRGASHGMS